MSIEIDIVTTQLLEQLSNVHNINTTMVSNQSNTVLQELKIRHSLRGVTSTITRLIAVILDPLFSWRGM